jgi:hypothetical protein
MDDEPIFYIFKRQILVTSFQYPYGFFLFHYFGAIYISIFYDTNISKYAKLGRVNMGILKYVFKYIDDI